MKRNLLFHLYPVRGSCWKWHIEKLVDYRNAWNAKKVIVVAQDDRTVPTQEVRQAAEVLGAEFSEVKNDPRLNEVPHFHNHLKLFESQNSDEALFYAHGKGVTRPEFLRNILTWAEAMYYVNLSCPELIEALLRRYKAVGAFRHCNQNHGGSRWHFSGTFFWLRHDAIFGGAWDKPYGDRYGVEGFPGRIVPEKESISLTEGADYADLYQHPAPKDKYLSSLETLKKKFLSK